MFSLPNAVPLGLNGPKGQRVPDNFDYLQGDD